MFEFKFTQPDEANGRTKRPLADVEIHIPAAGIKIEGAAIWRKKDGGTSVTLPARKYTDPETKEDAFWEYIRPIEDGKWSNVKVIKTAIATAYEEQ